MGVVSLPSGLDVDLSASLLTRFCEEEWAYYDGVPDRDPDRILPVDVAVTVAMNSWIGNATLLRSVHRGLAAACDPLLPHIPVEANLLTFDPDLSITRELFEAACQVKDVLLARATKVIHRKRRAFIPMLDNVVVDAYCDALGRTDLKAKAQDGRHAGTVGILVMKAFREDLAAATEQLRAASEVLLGAICG